MTFETSMVLLYLGLGVLMCFVGGMFRPRGEPRPLTVVALQFVFLTTLWMPLLLWHAVIGTGGKRA